MPKTAVLQKTRRQVVRWETASVRSRFHGQVQPLQVAVTERVKFIAEIFGVAA